MRTLEDLKMLQALPLDAKVLKTKQRIREWYRTFDGKVYVSFSGGKDSTVLLHIVRELYPEVEAVFVDTGLEYPEIREFVKSVDNVTWVRPSEKNPNRFQRMKQTHPKIYDYCMRSWDEGGLGMAEVLAFIGVETDYDQYSMEVEK